MVKDLYIKTAHVGKEVMTLAPELDLLPIFLDLDIRSNMLTRCYNGTAIHFPELGPSSFSFSKFHGGYIKEEEFLKEYRIDLMSKKNILGSLERLEFLKNLSGAVGLVLLDGIGYPKFVDTLAEFLNETGFIENPIEPFNYE